MYVGLTAIVTGFDCNCNFYRVVLSTRDHFGNSFSPTKSGLYYYVSVEYFVCGSP